MNFSEISNKFLKAISEVTGVKTCLTMQQMASIPGEPPRERITTRILNVKGDGNFSVKSKRAPRVISSDQYNSYVGTLSINFITDMEKAMITHEYFNHEKIRYYFSNAEITIVRLSPMVDLSDVVNGNYREKYSFDIEFRVVRKSKLSSGVITQIKQPEYRVTGGKK